MVGCFEMEINLLSWYNNKYPQDKIVSLLDLEKETVIKNLNYRLLEAFDAITFDLNTSWDLLKYNCNENLRIMATFHQDFEKLKDINNRSFRRQIALRDKALKEGNGKKLLLDFKRALEKAADSSYDIYDTGFDFY